MEFRDKFLRVEAPHFVAGIYFDENGICSMAAPILSWARGKTSEYVIDYFNKKKWSYSSDTRG